MNANSRGTTSVAFLVSLLLCSAAFPALADPVLYTGTIRNLVRTGHSPPQVIPTFDGVLSVTASKGIAVDAGDADFATTIVVTNPPTFAGVLQ